VDTALFTIAEARFIDTKFYFKSTMMEELRSPHDYPGEGKVNSKSSKKHKSSTNEGMTHPMKNKGKEKVVENFVNIRYHVKPEYCVISKYQQEKQGQSFFTKDEDQQGA
jgi:hypothetical protein